MSTEDCCSSVCGIAEDVVYEAIRTSVLSEGGSRVFPYNMFKWWSRRFSVFARLLAAALITSDKSKLLKVIWGKVPGELTLKARGKLIYDPFCGAGTLLMEAAKVGFNGLGVDVNPAAVAIARNSFKILSKCNSEDMCSSILLPLLKSLERTWHDLKHLWVIGNRYLLIHLFLTRCPPCKAPVWIATKRRKGDIEYLVINESNGELKWISKNKLVNITPKEPSVSLDPRNLPKVCNNYYAYVAEVLDLHNKQRFFVSLLEKGRLSNLIKKHTNTSMRESSRLLEEYYPEHVDVRIPVLRETRRLFKHGMTRIHELFTPRQLLSLLKFIDNTKGDVKELASLIAGNVARTASLLAFYYQPYSKVNPGLQIKSYWLPESPVELNPLAHMVKGTTVRTMGRGTIATYISKLASNCKKLTTEKHMNHVTGSVTVIQHDCTRFRPPKNVFAVITDPPYPGLFNYRELSLLYEFFLNPSQIRVNKKSQEIDVFNEKLYLKAMDDLARILSRLRKGTPIILLVGVKSRKYARILREIVVTFYQNNLGLAKLYWFIGESYGRLGRTRSRGVFVLVFINGFEPCIEIEKDLNASLRILEKVMSNNKLNRLIDPKHERKILLTVEQELKGRI